MFKYVQICSVWYHWITAHQGSRRLRDWALFVGLEPERLRFHHEIGKAILNPVESSLERQSSTASAASVGKSARLHFFQDALTVFSGLFSGLWQSASSASCNAHNCTATTPCTPIALPLRSVSLGLKQPSTCPEGLLQEERTQYLWFQSASVASFLLPTCCPGTTWNNMEQHP